MTTRPNYRLNTFQSVNIRMLKRDYGSSITVYELVSATTNLASGVKSAIYNSYPISKAVVLPVHVIRNVIQTISIISANKKMLQGGTFDAGDRFFIIDRKDVPTTFELEKDDWIEYGGQRFDIKYVDEYEQGTSWLVFGKVIEGVIPELHIRSYPDDNLSLIHTASAVLE